MTFRNSYAKIIAKYEVIFVFFESESFSFNILEVLRLSQKNVNVTSRGRNFCALSFRFRADTDIIVGEERIHLCAGSVCFFPSRLDYTRVSALDELIVIHFETSSYTKRAVEFFTPCDPSVYADAFSRMLSCWEEKKKGYKYRASAILYEIFAECYAENARERSIESAIQGSVDFLLASYRDPNITVGDIAKRSFMSEVYFRRLFKKEYGISPTKYIIKLRLQCALELISSGYYSLSEVARMSGYNDYKYFSAEFKRAVGVPPSEYLYNYKSKAKPR